MTAALDEYAVHTDRPVLQTDIVMVTPEIARSWLATMLPNRSLSKNLVSKYAADMRAGRWVLSAQPVQFDEDGNLFDGQHRLWAICEADLPIQMFVVYNAPALHVDEGRSRKVSDKIGIAGVLNAHAVAAATVMILRYEHRTEAALASAGSVPVRGSIVLDRALNDPAIGASVSFCISNLWTGWMPPSIIGFTHYMAKHLDVDKADKFVTDCRDGANLQRGDPAFMLRQALLTQRARRAQPGRDYIAALTVKAWNAYDDGRRIQILKWPSDEAFPRFREPSAPPA